MALKTPGVYIVEKNAFPNSVVEAATAIPAFIGYTERAEHALKPLRIATMAEFEQRFGGAPKAKFALTAPGQALTQVAGRYFLYYGMRHFFQNGGGPCYIVSAGDYRGAPTREHLIEGIDALVKEREPTMLVIPDAMLLGFDDCIAVQQAALAHCGMLQTRVAILDVWGGDKAPTENQCIENFRGALVGTALDYGAAYYPWLGTTVVPDAEVTADLLDAAPLASHFADIKAQLNLLPPSAAMAGIYTMMDNTRGVWKAPANVSVNGVVAPAVDISHADHEDLNVSPTGRSINAIRAFAGRGVLVWGARTLDGNSQDRRYINVRRTLIMIEQSCRLALEAMVFEANDAKTWITVQSTLENFLTGIWKRGGLAGASPEDAFGVQVGLGTTMTQDDILYGIMRVTVMVAVTRPAEFIVITMQQKMQGS